VLKIPQEWCVFFDVDVLVVDVLDERVGPSEYRYSVQEEGRLVHGPQYMNPVHVPQVGWQMTQQLGRK
jgi:hypothetical protein